jgi:undecaprenyl-diphosphatase
MAHAVVSDLVHRTRPAATDWLAPAGGWAYPSGHTTQAVATWGVLALLLAVHAGPRRRALLGLGATSLALLVGASRIYLGVHWPTDVLGGATMSAAVLAGWAILRRSVFASPTLPLTSAVDVGAAGPLTTAAPGSEDGGQHVAA